MSSKKALGKGLAALMGDSYSEYTGEEGDTLRLVPISSVEPNPEQPRRLFNADALEELKASIQQHGILQPILVRPVGEDEERFQIIAGERRWRAAKLAGLETVPVIVKDFNRNQTLEVALLENIQRQDLNPIEEASAYFRLMEEFQYTQEALAASVGKSRSHIANLLRLLTLPENIKRVVESGEISMGHARAILNHPHADKIVEQITKRGLSVRQTEMLAKQLLTPPGETPRPAKTARSFSGSLSREDPDLAALEEAISESLGLKVKITYIGDGGVVSIDYHNLSELDQILRRLGGNTI